VLHLPLNDILGNLPATVAPLLLARPGGTFSLPVRSAIEQLGTGAVRVRFAQLRLSALPGTFANDTSQDETLIDLPLPQILTAMGPAAFARRSQQKVTELPDDVTGVFGPKGKMAPRAASAPPAPASPPPPVAGAAPMPPPPQVAAAPPAPVVPTPAAPTPQPKPAPSIKPPSPVSAPKPPTAAPLPFAAAKPASPLPFATRPAQPAPTTAPPAPQQAAALDGDAETVVTTIGAISQLWPDEIRQEIQQFNLSEASVFIPVSRLGAGMRAGRVVFAWSEVLGWLSAPPPAPSSQGAVELQLPLGVIAPLFIGKHRAATPQKKVAIGQDIPDLFAGLGKPAASTSPSAPTAAAAAPVVAAPAAAAAPQKNALGELFGQPTKNEWTPQEIAQQIAALPGVSGSLLATADGLLIAGQVPAPLEAETLAAFLPQVFGRIASYAGEIKLVGNVRAVTISTDFAPCAMLKAGKLYVAVPGKVGQSLPDAILLRIAAELTKLNP
jgi:predicted regulator of Ras-like GTPase activity (Roadblock/LC7/MglB family)